MATTCNTNFQVWFNAGGSGSSNLTSHIQWANSDKTRVNTELPDDAIITKITWQIQHPRTVRHTSGNFTIEFDALLLGRFQNITDLKQDLIVQKANLSGSAKTGNSIKRRLRWYREGDYVLYSTNGGILYDSLYYVLYVEFETPSLTWSNASLSLSQATTSRQVTATKGGTATANTGDTVTYKLLEGSTEIGTFSNNTLTFTPSAGSHTYKVVAYAGSLSADGASSSITVVEPSLTWGTASLTLTQSQNSFVVTATKEGSATHNRGEAVTYKLYEGSTLIATYSGASVYFESSIGSHTYKVVASAGGLTADGPTATITVKPLNKTVKYYNGSQYVECIPYYYINNEFIEVEPYYYNGSEWVECSHS